MIGVVECIGGCSRGGKGAKRRLARHIRIREERSPLPLLRTTELYCTDVFHEFMGQAIDASTDDAHHGRHLCVCERRCSWTTCVPAQQHGVWRVLTFGVFNKIRVLRTITAYNSYCDMLVVAW